MKRAVVVAVVAVTGALVGPAAAGASPGSAQPRPLPAHGQRAVCGVPVAQAARCHAHVVTQWHSAAPLATSIYQYGFTPAQLQSAYQLPSSTASPTVAVVDAYDNPYAASDLQAYRTAFRLGSCGNTCFTKVDQNGQTDSYPQGDTNWGAEIDLDIEMVSAACPSCHILLVEANSNSFSDLMAAEDYATSHATFVSNSWGAAEFAGETSYDQHFDHADVGITVSSGDNGYGVEYPAASPYVTAVGGTSLTQSSSGWTQTAWSGGGSGCSVLEPKPSWQTDSGCGNRTVTDVSADADPNTGVAVYDSYGSTGGNDWFVYGGTSVAAPFVAGVWALTGAVASGTNAPSVPYANASGWTDVTSGSNSHHCRDGYLCQAMVGYDGPTGLGTPIGATGFGGSATGGSGGGTTTNSPPTASFRASCTDLTCDFNDTSKDSDGTVVGWTWHFGDETTSTEGNPHHTYTTGNTYTVSLTVTDNDGATGTTSQSVTVTAAPSSGITLSATGYKSKGYNTVALSWTGGTGSFDVYASDRTQPVSVSGTSYLDDTGDHGSGSYTYYVCEQGSMTACSNKVTVVF